MAKSTVQPKQIELLYQDGNLSKYKLTKIIGEKDFTNDFTKEVIKLYEYEEYDMIITTTDKLEIDIKNNFNYYWEFAKKQSYEKSELERKLTRYSEFQKDGKLVDMILMGINQITEMIINM